MPVSDADRIAADGIPLTLGGREVRVRYTLRSWKEAEDRFGSLDDVFTLLRGLIDAPGDDAEPVKKKVGTIIPLLWMGLLHEGLSEEQVYDLGVIKEILIYRDAILEAISEGTPEPGRGKEEAAAVDSPGPTTTTPPPSDMAVAMSSSGT